MTNIGTLENKISSVRRYLTILKRYSDLDLKTLQKNYDKKGASERYLYLLCQSTIDLAEMIISYKKLRKPMSLSENFEILRENCYISDELCSSLISMSGFRNALAHGYEKIDKRIMEILKDGKKDILGFLEIAEKLI